MRIKFSPLSKQKGISLIELIIFIVILSVALTGITLIYINTTRYSADPLMRIRSIQLAQSMIEEVLLKAYDESTPVGGGCVDFPSGSTLCTSSDIATSQTSATLGAEEGSTNRASFDDVDDYHNLLYCGDGVSASNTACTALTCQDMLDESGADISSNYRGYSICIQVSFMGGAANEINNFGTGVTVLTNDAKRIDVTVTDPLRSIIKLSAYRLNF